MTLNTDKFVIAAEDLQDEAVDHRVAQMQSAAAPQMVRSVGVAPAPVSGVSKFLRGNVGMLGLAGLLGGIVGWVISEMVMGADGGSSGGDLAVETAIWLATFAAGLGAVMSAFEGVQLRSLAKVRIALLKSVPVVAGGALVGGYLAQSIYEPIIESAYRRAIATGSVPEAESIMLGAMRFGRGVGFMVAGIAIGCALGAATGAKKRALNGAIGGAVGGFAGGFVFDWVGMSLGDGSGAGPSRLVALTLTGVLVGIAIGLVEQVRKDHWIEIVSGGMAGKQFILYHDTTEVGSDPACAVTLIKDPAIAARHVSLTQTPRGLLARQLSPIAPLMINGQQAAEHLLSDGDLVQVGTTVLRYGQRGQSMPTLRQI